MVTLPRVTFFGYKFDRRGTIWNYILQAFVLFSKKLKINRSQAMLHTFSNIIFPNFENPLWLLFLLNNYYFIGK